MGLDINSFSLSNDKPAPEYVPSAKLSTPVLPPSMVEDKSPMEHEIQAEQAGDSAPVESVEQQPVEAEQQVEEQAAPRVRKLSEARFSQLARREAELNRERQRLREEKAAVEEAARAAKQFEERKAKARLNPVEALKDLGLSYEEVSEFVVNDNKPPVSAEVQAIRDEIERLREEQRQEKEEMRRITEEQLQQQQENVISRFNQDAISFVSADPERYAFTLANDGAHYVPEIIEKHFHATGELLSVDKAAEIVEAHFEEVADRVAKSSKFKAKVSPQAPITQVAATTPAKQPVAPAKRPVTLSNAMTASASSATPVRRTEQDRIRAALARLEGK
jgi:hypothetical protein